MSGMNLVMVVGNLGRDPESRTTPSGTVVTNFSLAVNSVRKDKNTGERIEETEWVRCVTWQRTAEIARDYLRKGSLAGIRGKLRTRKWTDKEGRDQYTTEVQVDDLTLLGKRVEGEGSSQAPSASSYPSRATSPAAAAPAAGGPDIPFEDDIPF